MTASAAEFATLSPMKTFLLIVGFAILPGCAFHEVSMTTDPNQQQQEKVEQKTEDANDAARETQPGEPLPEAPTPPGK